MDMEILMGKIMQPLPTTGKTTSPNALVESKDILYLTTTLSEYDRDLLFHLPLPTNNSLFKKFPVDHHLQDFY